MHTHTQRQRSSDNVNCHTGAHIMCIRTHTYRENKGGEAGKQCSTMLSGRDLSLQKKRFPITRHSFSLSHTQKAGVRERERDLYDVLLGTHNARQTILSLTLFSHSVALFPPSSLSLAINRSPGCGLLSVLCFSPSRRSQSFIT